ncbi:hypothetical protein CC86DRAFT_368405 [Ophiobolus disseminans]|uniref:Uncharacterized protein n=1 Tax=Ophiobolus disseminans TaxID=1469910 RepID=A0A6A7A871_9PLEO|nr:hypothetical protein CC86DRAFT_368405 [Ophiobolus disseminans]
MHSKDLSLALGLLAQLVSAQEVTPAPRPGSYSLLRRDGTPTAACPEQFGNPLMNCNDPACGGKSDTAQVCKNNSGNGKPCQCQIGTAGAPVPSNTKVTATNSAGSTIVGVYALVTIDKYKSLKQQQTVTFTQTSTGKDGKETVAAAAAVVAAGGVAWILGTGADAAGAALLKAPSTPNSNKDDPGCPAKKNKCKDCKAVSGINICVTPNGGCGCEPEEQCPAGDAKPKCSDKECTGQNDKCTVGKNKDCACKSASCPTGDKQPQCDNKEKCSGKDGKCTLGDNKDCACKSCPTGDKQPQCDNKEKCSGKDGKCTLGDDNGCACKENACPEKRYTPFCDFCGNKGSDGKCKGIADKNNLWKGCDCWEEPPNPVDYPQLDQALLKVDVEGLPKISPSSYSYGGDDPLKCQNLSYDAKRDVLQKSIAEWCKSVNSKEVTKSGATEFNYKRYDYDYYSYWLAAGYDGKSGGNCGDKAKITEINCVSTMMEALSDCNIGQDKFKGAELTDGCVRYQITFSRSKKDNDPPFKPLTQELATCANGNDDVSAVPFNFWQGVSKKFCKDVGDGKTAKKAELKNTDLQTRSLFGRTPPPNPKAYGDWKFFFEWEPKSGTCAKTCDEAMSSFTNSCGHYGNQGNNMLKKGTVDTGCGKYTYRLEGPPPPTKPTPTPTPTPTPWIPNTTDCRQWFSLFFIRFGITFNTDEGKMRDELKGCGAITDWKIEEQTSVRKYITFNLPVALKAGCVERAMKTATGLDTKCLM